ncbi:hypothetical protein DL768_007833 [Monosporascus sp. mg162]|nr:hypothetical protein DL768_007833 [Monosporascus sp. mg162]
MLSSELGGSEDTAPLKGVQVQNSHKHDSASLIFSSPSMSGGIGITSNPLSTSRVVGTEFGFGLPSAADAAQMSKSECSSRLHRLRLELSNTLQQYLEDSACFWDGYMSNLGLSQDTMEQDTVRNPFGDALCNTSELLTIIQCYTQEQHETSSSGGSMNQGGHPLAPAPSQHATLDLVNILDILSAYVQIMAIYDGLFQRLHTALRSVAEQETSDAAAPLQTLPGLQLAGLSVRQGNLQTKILMQVILHQFATLEKVLPLPGELRVSKRRELYTGGLFGRDERTRVLVDGFLAAGMQSLEGHVASIRINMDKVKRLLEI